LNFLFLNIKAQAIQVYTFAFQIASQFAISIEVYYMGKVTRYLVCLVLFGLFGCSQENVITKVTKAQNNPVSDNAISTVKPTVTPNPESPVKPIGHFTNVKSNGEHQWGFVVELWRQDDKIYGWMSGSDDSRLVGDAPAAILEDVQFDLKTGKFSFKAAMPSNFGGFRRSKDVHKFDGFLTKKSLTGNLLITDDFCGESCTKKKKITLLKSKKDSADLEEFFSFGSYQEWKAWMDKIL
jgi:hypothetical protein